MAAGRAGVDLLALVLANLSPQLLFQVQAELAEESLELPPDDEESDGDTRVGLLSCRLVVSNFRSVNRRLTHFER